MYLKIMDSKKGVWVYIDDFNRLEAPKKKSFKPSEDILLNRVEDLETLLLKHDEDVTHAYLKVLDTNLMLEDLLNDRPITYQVIRCWKELADGTESYFNVAFNTVVFLCSDRGHTMDRFVLHKVY